MARLTEESTTMVERGGPVPATRFRARDGQADAIEALYLSGPSALGCGLSLAMQAAELCGDRRIRVELPPFGTREDPSERRASVNLSAELADARVMPVRGPGGSERAEALLHVEEGRAGPASGLDDLTRFVRQAGLVLERHRLAREVGRVQWEAAQARTDLAHSLRGPLNSALLRVDALLYGDREATLGGDRVRKDLQGLRDSVLSMAERIQSTLDVPDTGGRSGSSDGAGPMGSERISDLLFAAWAAGGPSTGGDLTLDIEAGVGFVPSGHGRLQAALAELLDMTRRSRAARAIAVTADPPGAVRVTVRLELPEAPPPGPGTGEPERKPVPSLPDVVAELGGRTWIDVGPDGVGEVTLVLPAVGGGERADPRCRQ
ncbi:MAG TPA: hypothetical protein VLL48_04655 [Longimicrobiales bacterium]|nr:hypothetical protein [Longimicrobiales bacterium]